MLQSSLPEASAEPDIVDVVVDSAVVVAVAMGLSVGVVDTASEGITNFMPIRTIVQLHHFTNSDRCDSSCQKLPKCVKRWDFERHEKSVENGCHPVNRTWFP